MEKLSQFGIEPLLLVAQICNFLILLFILKRFLYKPVLTMLKKRQERIQEGLAQGARGEELLVKAKEEEKVILAKASEEAGLLLAETKQRAVKMEEDLLSQTKEESEQMIAHARTQIEEERQQVERELEKEAAHSAIRVLEGILPKVLTREDQVRILETGEKLLRKAMI